MKKWAVWIVLPALILTLAGCDGGATGNPEWTDSGSDTQGFGSIESFSFSLQWGGHGESYDSKTGSLTKEVHYAREDYAATYLLTEEQKQQIYDLLSELDVTSYPTAYDPQSGTSFPSMSLILSVRTDTVQKTIAARDIAFWRFTSEDPKGQAFLSACKTIIDLLEQTEEWKALPEYDYWLD